MTGVSPEHTSVPRWPSAPPAADPAGRRFLVLSEGAAAASVAAAWISQIEAMGRPFCAHHGAGAGVLRQELDGARVGLRIMLAGPELGVLDRARLARGAGAIDAELTLFVTGTAAKRVQCPHCHEHTIAEADVDEVIVCAGCERRLVVYHHVSRRHGAYFGYMVDAEEAAA